MSRRQIKKLIGLRDGTQLFESSHGRKGNDEDDENGGMFELHRATRLTPSVFTAAAFLRSSEGESSSEDSERARDKMNLSASSDKTLKLRYENETVKNPADLQSSSGEKSDSKETHGLNVFNGREAPEAPDLVSPTAIVDEEGSQSNGSSRSQRLPTSRNSISPPEYTDDGGSRRHSSPCPSSFPDGEPCGGGYLEGVEESKGDDACGSLLEGSTLQTSSFLSTKCPLVWIDRDGFKLSSLYQRQDNQLPQRPRRRLAVRPRGRVIGGRSFLRKYWLLPSAVGSFQ